MQAHSTVSDTNRGADTVKDRMMACGDDDVGENMSQMISDMFTTIRRCGVTKEADIVLISSDLVRLMSERARLQAAKVAFEVAKVEQRTLEMQTIPVEASPPPSLSTVSTVSSSSSRDSKRFLRRKNYLDSCAKLHEERGYCYLLMFKVGCRKAAKKALGPFPGVLQLLTYTPEAFDLDAMKMLGYHVEDEYVHVDEDVVLGNTMYGYLSRTLVLFSHVKTPLHDMIILDYSDGHCMNARTKLGGRKIQPVGEGYTAPKVDIDVFRPPLIAPVAVDPTAASDYTQARLQDGDFDVVRCAGNGGNGRCVGVTRTSVLPAYGGKLDLSAYAFTNHLMWLPTGSSWYFGSEPHHVDHPVMVHISGISNVKFEGIDAGSIFALAVSDLPVDASSDIMKWGRERFDCNTA